MTGNKERVVIVGGGFGGLACARALEGKQVDVLLLDARDYHLFTPLLYQVATALLNPSDIAYPLRTRFRRSRNVRFRQTWVQRIDLTGKAVYTRDGEKFGYDHLVLATGSTNNYFGKDELAAHSIGLKSLEEALRLRNHVLACLELAARAQSDAERREWLTFVIAGGGPTGVEYAGALAELLKLVLGRDFPELQAGSARVLLIEGQDHLLPGFPKSLGHYAARKLAGFGVAVRLGTLVERAGARTAQLSGGETVATRTIVWSAGVTAQAPESSPATARRRNRIEVDEHLRIPGAEDAYAIGDAAAVPSGEDVLPMLSAPAMQEGRYVAREILGRIEDAGESPPKLPFRYWDKGTMATIGRNAAVASVWHLRFKGFIGWLAWLAVHLYYLVGFRNRLAVFWAWGWAYLRQDRPIRIIAVAEADSVADELEKHPLSQTP